MGQESSAAKLKGYKRKSELRGKTVREVVIARAKCLVEQIKETIHFFCRQSDHVIQIQKL